MLKPNMKKYQFLLVTPQCLFNLCKDAKSDHSDCQMSKILNVQHSRRQIDLQQLVTNADATFYC